MSLQCWIEFVAALLNMVVCKALFLLTLFGSAAAAVFKASQTGRRRQIKMAPVISGRRSRARLKKKPVHKNVSDVQPKTTPACCFCSRTEDNIEKYGERLTDAKTNLSAHYYCLVNMFFFMFPGLVLKGKVT
ncbi:hypothetical protein NDU88_006715 [Pleurodeles waltl]|uniref:Uncharacterized protein n=1 Tax=Pleurodeles waltl TaxID=8319 RepID=A0AAV7RN08_PLEWA|nr:hypothetical protein NDU88_006715 [Pleurodeles waltl]